MHLIMVLSQVQCKMSSKQNIVFFLGLILIAMVFWIHGYWSILYNGIIAPNNGGTTLLPGPNGIPPNPKTHKCPGPNYFEFNGKCYPTMVNLPGHNGPTLTSKVK